MSTRVRNETMPDFADVQTGLIFLHANGGTDVP
jgi:hypothetical protein